MGGGLPPLLKMPIYEFKCAVCGSIVDELLNTPKEVTVCVCGGDAYYQMSSFATSIDYSTSRFAVAEKETMGESNRKQLGAMESAGLFKKKKLLRAMNMTEGQAKEYWDRVKVKSRVAQERVRIDGN